MSSELNILNKPLQLCSLNPKTGYFRDGFCRSINEDQGVHTVCAKMNPEFLKFTASKGNELSRVVSSGENWCLCQNRWEEAYQSGKSPEVILESTNKVTKENIQNHISKEHQRKKNKKSLKTKRKFKNSKKKKILSLK